MTRTIYTGKQLEEISFPLGGIGTGSLGLAGNGRLVDWEIFNKPNKSSVNGHSHFAVKAMRDGKLVDARVLNGDTVKNLAGVGFGLPNDSMAGFPHFRHCTFTGEYPLAKIEFSDPDSPLTAVLQAFNPFIPHYAKDSSIPAAFFTFTLTNNTDGPLDISVAATLKNPYGGGRNRYADGNGYHGIVMKGPQTDRTKADYGEMLIATDENDISWQEDWYRGGWFDMLETYWRNLTECETFYPRSYDNTDGSNGHGTLCARRTLQGGKSADFRFLIAWYNPTKPDQWKHGQEEDAYVPNYYSFVYDGVQAVAGDCFGRWDALWNGTKRWHDELFASTMPEEVLEAVSATSSVLKTETSIRIGEKGDFYGWEGLGPHSGSCEGTCTHVWNYAYALPFLFPELERGIRENDYAYNQKPSGEMVFRTRIPFGRGIGGFRACVDGQMGGVIKVYREWKLSGDTEWLRSIWAPVKKSLEYAWSGDNYDRWDADKDGMLEGRQHHTLDMELFGPSSWLEGFYLGALKAGAEMAEALGDEDAVEYRRLFALGKQKCAETLFNGRYFYQQVDLTDKATLESFGALNYWNDEAGEIKYQIGEGCEIDQLLAQWHADILGLGDLFDLDQVQTALVNMVKYNFKENMRGHYNTFRLFAVNDESGAIICEWPDDVKKPAIPIPYAQEAMHGFEYSFAGLLISRGLVEEGLRVVRGIRDRYRGDNRNPWNEIECGSNYARSMASFALLPILSGMQFDMVKGALGFAPILKGDFRTVWFVGDAWGNVQLGAVNRLEIVDGTLKLNKLTLPIAKVEKVLVDGAEVAFDFVDGAILFPETVAVSACMEIL